MKTNVEPKAQDLERKIRENVFAVLRGPWHIRCGICGSEADYVLEPALIESMVTHGFIRVQCCNPDCRNHGPLLAVNKKLRELIDNFLTGPLVK